MFSIPLWGIWLILCATFLLIEIFTVSFLMFWPGIGAFLAFVASVFNANLPVQISVFAVSTTLMILFMKPLAKKLFKYSKEIPMNNKSVVSKTGIVVKEIDTLESTGQVKVNGELWSAFTEEDKKIPVGTEVLIEDVEGVKLKVKTNDKK